MSFVIIYMYIYPRVPLPLKILGGGCSPTPPSKSASGINKLTRFINCKSNSQRKYKKYTLPFALSTCTWFNKYHSFHRRTESLPQIYKYMYTVKCWLSTSSLHYMIMMKQFVLRNSHTCIQFIDLTLICIDLSNTSNMVHINIASMCSVCHNIE